LIAVVKVPTSNHPSMTDSEMEKLLLKSSSHVRMRFRSEICELVQSVSELRSDGIGAVGGIIKKGQRFLMSRLSPTKDRRSAGEVNNPRDRSVTGDGDR
jgi:hypothetical protein